MRRIFAAALAVAAASVWPIAAEAQGTVKIGLILPFSGQFADAATNADNGIKLYLAEHGGTIAGKTLEIIRRDVGGIAPDVAKRLAQELVVRDKVDVLAGFLLTPNAMAAGVVSEQAGTFMVVMNAATSVVTEQSQFMTRVSNTSPQLNETFGAWVAKNAAKTVHTMVADYGPGHDAEQAFARGFTGAGGTIAGADRMPVANPDFSAFVLRAKAAEAEGIYVWVPGGSQPPAVAKALVERGIDPKTTTILGQGELTGEEALASMGDIAEGIVTVMNYDFTHESETNRAFVAAYNAAYGKNPDFFALGGYDGMHLIFAALEKTKGDTSGTALIAAAKGMAWESPRGPVSIDPETRDIVQTIYIRRVEKVGGKLVNVEFDKVENVKDPVKARK